MASLFARLGVLGRCVNTLLPVGVTLMQLIALGPPVVTSKALTGMPRASGPIVILVLALWPVAPCGLLWPLVVAWLFVLLPLVSGTLMRSWALGSMLRGFVLAGRLGPIVLGIAWRFLPGWVGLSKANRLTTLLCIVG